MAVIFYKTIRFRIAVISAIIFILISTVGAVVCYILIRKTVERAAFRQTESQAYALLDRIEIDPVLIPLPQADEAARIELISSDSVQVLFESPQLKQFKITNRHNFRHNPVVHVTKLIDTETVLSVFFTSTRPEIAETLNRIAWVLGITIVFSGSIAAWLAYLAGNIFLQPIRHITEVARKIHLSERPQQVVEVPQTYDEVQQLAETFNQMLVRIGNEVEKQNHFFASASHELRTPLAILQTEIQVRLKGGNLPEDIQKLLENQLAETHRLRNLVEDFLMVSSLKNPDLLLLPTTVKMDELVLEVADRFTLLLHQRQLRLRIDLDANTDSFGVHGDASKLKTVISNLFDNSIKYAPENDLLHIKLFRNEQQKVTLIFENHYSGSGIDLDALTNAFYQTDTLASGFGMGLWISRRILELHQATLSLTNENEMFCVQIQFPFFKIDL